MKARMIEVIGWIGEFATEDDETSFVTCSGVSHRFVFSFLDDLFLMPASLFSSVVVPG